MTMAWINLVIAVCSACLIGSGLERHEPTYKIVALIFLLIINMAGVAMALYEKNK